MAFNLPRIRNKSELQNNSSKRSYIDDVFNNFFNEIASFSSSYTDRMLSPRTDIIENDSEYNLEMELPGVTQDNIDLKIDSNILTIEGKKENLLNSGIIIIICKNNIMVLSIVLLVYHLTLINNV